MFSTDYQGYEDWEQTREATLIPALGISAYNAYNFVLGHVIFSFAAPVALAESWRPERAREPWLGLAGVLIAALAYVGAAALILADPESHSGSVPQLVISAGLVIAFAMAAVAVGRRNPVMRGAMEPAPSGRRLPVWAVLAGAFVAALIAGMAGDDWTGLVVSVAITALLGVVVLRASRQSWWTCRHTAAVGLAFLLVRGLLAFTYFPLLGEAAAGPKYAHNVAMLLIVLLAGWFALRAPSDRPGLRLMSIRRPGRADRSSLQS